MGTVGGDGGRQERTDWRTNVSDSAQPRRHSSTELQANSLIVINIQFHLGRKNNFFGIGCDDSVSFFLTSSVAIERIEVVEKLVRPIRGMACLLMIII